MKILVTQELFSPDITGGAEKLTLKMIQGLQKKGYSVKVVCSGNPQIKSYEGIETIRIPWNRYLMNLALPQIIMHSRDVDLIHTSSGNMCLPSWMAAKVNKKPIVCYIHHIFGSNWRKVRGNILGRVFQVIESVFLNRSYDAIVFQNKLSKSIGLKIGVDEKRTRMIQPGIDYKKFDIKIKKEPLVLFVGNFRMDDVMVRIKGLNYLIEAAKNLPDVKFVIVGEGSGLDKLKNSSPVNVDFTGGLVGKSLLKMYNRALVFCLPSLTEGFSLTLLEAMASGCATISTVDIGQEGILIKPKDVDKIVNSVKYFTDNPKKAKKVGRKNKELAKRFTWDKFIEELIKIYDPIIKKN